MQGHATTPLLIKSCRCFLPNQTQGMWVDGRMHGDGTFIDAEGRRWCGQFFNGSGPGLTFQL